MPGSFIETPPYLTDPALRQGRLENVLRAMILNPKAMKKAQEELDRVVGKGELPDFSHKDSLPYIDALIKEVLRWSPPLPLAVQKGPCRTTFTEDTSSPKELP
jgi:cytochrome P450